MESRDIIRRIRDRDLYKCVDWKVIEWSLRGLFREKVTSKHIVEEVKRRAVSDPLPPNFPELKESDVIVDFSTMHYGMKEENPLKYVKFYSKRSPTSTCSVPYSLTFCFSSPNDNEIGTGCRNAEKGDYLNLQPECFAEILLRIYTKKPEYWGRVQAGYRSILDSLNATHPSENSIGALTPPATEAPSTPRTRASSLANFENTESATATKTSAATPFSNNSFTTVSPTFMPKSPTRNGRKRANGREDRSLSPLRKRTRH